MSGLTLSTIWLHVAALSTASLVACVVCAESRIVDLDFPTVVNFASCICVCHYGCSHGAVAQQALTVFAIAQILLRPWEEMSSHVAAFEITFHI